MSDLQLLIAGCAGAVFLIIVTSIWLIMRHVEYCTREVGSQLRHEIQQALLKATPLAPGGEPLINVIARARQKTYGDRD